MPKIEWHECVGLQMPPRRRASTAAERASGSFPPACRNTKRLARYACKDFPADDFSLHPEEGTVGTTRSLRIVEGL